MYRKKDKQQTIDDFILPFDGALSADNRWVTKAQLIPWDDSDLFPSDTGNVAKPARVAFGALVIKKTLGLTDEETARQDARDRNCSEGKFGEGKRRYGLNLIKTKLQETSETIIIMNLIVMNLARLQRGLFVLFSKSLFCFVKAKMLPRPSFILPAAA